LGNRKAKLLIFIWKCKYLKLARIILKRMNKFGRAKLSNRRSAIKIYSPTRMWKKGALIHCWWECKLV
jgi:hypothetical protein